MEPVIKSPKMQRLEAQRGRDIREILRAAYAEHGATGKAAASLGVSHPTFCRWSKAFGLRVRHLAP